MLILDARILLLQLPGTLTVVIGTYDVALELLERMMSLYSSR
jgi:hypothetical protein